MKTNKSLYIVFRSIMYSQNCRGGPRVLGQLPNELLLESYCRAIEHQLSPDFISILRDELFRRGMINQCG